MKTYRADQERRRAEEERNYQLARLGQIVLDYLAVCDGRGTTEQRAAITGNIMREAGALGLRPNKELE